jgi:thymidylate synthase
MGYIDKTYNELLEKILKEGKNKKDRTNTGTLSLFGYQIRYNMKQGFPLLTTKKMYYKGIITELLWFLNGDTNIKYLVDNGCNIWNDNSYKKYSMYAGNLEEPDYDVHVEDVQENRVRILTEKEFVERIKTDDGFAKKWGELGPIYGKQWRDWGGEFSSGHWNSKTNKLGAYFGGVDQIKNLIEQLKTNPDSRRLMVNAWNVGELDQMTLPPCHYGFQVYTRELSLNERHRLAEKSDDFDNTWNDHQEFDDIDIPRRAISLMWNQRSVDTFLGLPFNIASYGLLLEIIAKEVNMVPDELIGNLGDVHLYNNHITYAEEQVTMRDTTIESPELVFNKKNNIFDYNVEDFEFDNYKPQPNWKNVPIAV